MTTGLFDDYEDYKDYSLPENIGNIPLEQFETAIKLRKECLETLPDTASRRFLYTLAFGGFASWFTSWANSPGEYVWEVDAQNCSLYQPECTHTINTVCNLEINGFRICLIPFSHPFRNSIDIPRAVIDLPRWAAHFYIPVEVSTSGFVKTSVDDEGSPQVLIHGFWRYDQLRQQINAGQVEFKKNWNYSVPLGWCDSNLDHLWLSLNRLEPEMIPLPQASGVAELSLQDWKVWERRLERVRENGVSLWQVSKEMDWSDAKTFFDHPELIRKWYELCSMPPDSEPEPIEQRRRLVITWRSGLIFSQLMATVPRKANSTASNVIDRNSLRKTAEVIQGYGFTIPSAARVHDELLFELEKRTLKGNIFSWSSSNAEETELANSDSKLCFVIAVFMESRTPLNPEIKLTVNSSDTLSSEIKPKRGDRYLVISGTKDGQTTLEITVSLGNEHSTVNLLDVS